VCLQNHHGIIDFRNVRIRENPKRNQPRRTLRHAEKKCRLSSLCVASRSLRLICSKRSDKREPKRNQPRRTLRHAEKKCRLSSLCVSLRSAVNMS
jgi:hypothetical protein